MRATLAALALVLMAAAAAAAGPARTLVVLDDGASDASPPPLVAYLEGLGHQVTVREATEGHALKKYGKFLFDNVVLLAGQADELHESLSAEALADFARGGDQLVGESVEPLAAGVRNVVVAGARAASVRAFANACGVDFERANVVDHVSHAGDSPARVLTAAAATGPAAALGAEPLEGQIEYTGPAHAFRQDSALVQPVLDAEPTALSATTRDASEPVEPARLVSAVQMRHNARVLFSGSADLVAAAGPLAKRAVAWAVQRAGVLRIARFAHRKQGADEYDSPAAYRVKDDIEFAIDMEESDGAGGWRPFRGADVQLEVFRIDPFVRTTLRHNGKGRYTARFRLPDVFGAYKFRVLYHRGSLTFVEHVEKVALYPFRHNDYERFLFAAYPYYASSIQLMAGFFLFGLVFLYTK